MSTIIRVFDLSHVLRSRFIFKYISMKKLVQWTYFYFSVLTAMLDFCHATILFIQLFFYCCPSSARFSLCQKLECLQPLCFKGLFSTEYNLYNIFKIHNQYRLLSRLVQSYLHIKRPAEYISTHRQPTHGRVCLVFWSWVPCILVLSCQI